jgi:hypothetical protein
LYGQARVNIKSKSANVRVLSDDEIFEHFQMEINEIRRELDMSVLRKIWRWARYYKGII